MPMPQSNKVTILMGVYNGAAHLDAQLQSIAAQTYENWSLICSDDGSTDGTREIITRFATDHRGKVLLSDGPRAGFSSNYMQMMRDLTDDTAMVAFADQDDIWETDKLARAAQALETEGHPTLYASRCWYWYPESGVRKPSPSPARPATFRNALIENIATGNTIVLNPAAARFVRDAAQHTSAVFAHDWWLYLLMAGADYRIEFDTGAPTLLYRQHAENLIGGGQTLHEQVQRKLKVLQGALSDRIGLNIEALQQVENLLTAQNREVLDQFARARQAGFLRRLQGLRKVAPYRQTTLGTLGFWGAASLGRI